MNICTLGESLQFHNRFLGDVAAPQWVAPCQLEPITRLHYFHLHGLVQGHDSCPVTGHKSHEKGVEEPVMSGNWLEAIGYCT